MASPRASGTPGAWDVFEVMKEPFRSEVDIDDPVPVEMSFGTEIIFVQERALENVMLHSCTAPQVKSKSRTGIKETVLGGAPGIAIGTDRLITRFDFAKQGGGLDIGSTQRWRQQEK
jgi:hypothetical protein